MMALAMLAAALSIAASADGPGLRRVPYDAARPPTLTCSTKYGCELVLEPGERLRLASLFDDRWTAKVADDGASGMAPRVLIGPTAADEDDGHGGRQPLRTSLELLTTKREYVVELQSSGRYEQHRLGFTYRQLPAVVVRVEPPPPVLLAVTARPDEGTAVDPSLMDFGWKAEGDPAVRCVGTPFSIGSQLWCKLPADATEKPTAYRVDGSRRVPLPFHFVGQRYIVIDAPVWPVALVVGGSHERVATITRARE
jgi:Conjugal transfer protein